MESLGLSSGYLLVQLCNLSLLLLWPLLSVVALLELRQRTLPPTAQALWALLIALVPILGAVAFWIVQPGAKTEGA